jgi:TatD DNase family protein
MKSAYVDIHSHVSFEKFDSDRDEVLSRMREGDISTITVGVDLKSSRRAVELAAREEGVYAAIGLHPADNTDEEFDAAAFAELVQNPKTVAIGECGLDFYRRDGVSELERARQRKELDAQIAFALAHDKPLMIHCRSAHEEMLEVLTSYKKEAGEQLRGNIHFFTGTLPIARRYNELGFTVSFPGVITFAREYDDVVRELSLSMIMSETDAPYAAPVPHRGKRNEPRFVLETIKKIAELRGESFEAVSTTLRDNVVRVFGF